MLSSNGSNVRSFASLTCCNASERSERLNKAQWADRITRTITTTLWLLKSVLFAKKNQGCPGV